MTVSLNLINIRREIWRRFLNKRSASNSSFLASIFDILFSHFSFCLKGLVYSGSFVCSYEIVVGWNLLISVFLNLVQRYLVRIKEPNFEENSLLPQNGQNGLNMVIFLFFENFFSRLAFPVINLNWKIILVFICHCKSLIWFCFSRIVRKCPWLITLQGSLKCNILKKKLGIKLTFCMMQIK